MKRIGNRPRRLLFLFSDTGGGHRSTACAVAQTLRDLYGDRVQVDLVDALAQYAPWPFNHPSIVYPHMLRLKGLLWAIGFYLSDGARRVKLPAAGWRLLTGSAMRRLLRDHPADLIVSCHAAFNHLLLQLLPQAQVETRVVTLVTDLTAAHAFWFAPGVTRCLVPTGGTRRYALTRGMANERILQTGLPVRPCFLETAQDDLMDVRRRLGLRGDLPVVLVTNGAEGTGSLYRLCRAITSDGIRGQVVAIAGRNERQRRKLVANKWSVPVRVEGFVDNMDEWMRAADLLVTKAGPTTISEALIMGLPMVLSDALPGHERSNVDYVVRGGAGVWAPRPGRVVRAIRTLLSPESDVRARMAHCARRLAQPDAARRVAEVLWRIADGTRD